LSKDGVELEMSNEKQQNVNKILSAKDNTNMTNPKIFYAAKKKFVSEQLNDGY